MLCCGIVNNRFNTITEMENSNSSSFVNVTQLLTVYKKIWAYVLLSVVAFLILGCILYYRQPNRCEVVAQVLISDESSTASSPLSSLAGMFGGGAFGANRNINDEMVIIKSHSLLAKTAKELNLNLTYNLKENILKSKDIFYDQPVELIYDKAIADTLGCALLFKVHVNKSGIANVSMYGEKKRLIQKITDKALPLTIDSPYGVFTLIPRESFVAGESLDETISLVSYSKAALSLSKNIVVDYSEKKTDVILLQYITTDDRFGKELLDQLIANYNELTIQQKQEFNVKTLSFLEDRIRALSNEVDSTQSQVQNFMSNNNLVNPTAEAGIILQRSSKQEIDLIKAEAEYELLNMAIEFLSNEANNTSMLPIMPSTASLTPLINGYNALILERLTIESSAKGSNVALKAINNRIAAVRDNLNKHSETASVEISEMRRQYALTKRKLETVPGIEREYSNIMRQMNLKEQLYVYLLRQREETEMAIEGAHPKGVIIDEAYVSDAILKMSPKAVLAISFLIGLLFPGFIIILKWLFGKHISLIDQATDSTGLPLIASIPLSNTNGLQPAILKSSESLDARRIRLLRGNILSEFEAKCNTVIGAFGTVGREASEIAASLAVSLSMTGRKVLLIDADLFNPRIDSILDLSGEDNFQNVIKGNSVTPSVLNVGVAENSLSVLTCTENAAHGSDILASVQFAGFLNKVKQDYDFVIVSGPSVRDHFASVESISIILDCCLYTVVIDQSLRDDVKRVASLKALNEHSYIVEIVGCK